MSKQWTTMTINGKRYEVRDIDLDEEVVLDEHGKRITEVRATEMAEQTMHEIRRRRGQPSLSGAPRPSPRVTFRVPPELAEQAEATAAREGKSLSQLGREALERYLAN